MIETYRRLSKWYLATNALSFLTLVISYFAPWFKIENITNIPNLPSNIETIYVYINFSNSNSFSGVLVFLNISMIFSMFILIVIFILVGLEIVYKSNKRSYSITTVCLSILSNIIVFISMILGITLDVHKEYFSIGVGFIISCLVISTILSIISILRHINFETSNNNYSNLDYFENDGLLNHYDNNNNANIQSTISYQQQFESLHKILSQLQFQMVQIQTQLSNINNKKNNNDNDKDELLEEIKEIKPLINL